MDWQHLASFLWQPRIEIFITMAVLFALPLIRILLYPITLRGWFAVYASFPLGLFEEFIAPIRGIFGIPYLASGIVWLMILSYTTAENAYAMEAVLFVFLIATHFIFSKIKKIEKIACAVYLEDHPEIDPDLFYKLLLSSQGPFRVRVFGKPTKTVNLCAPDFTSSRPMKRLSISTYIVGAWSIMKLARLTALLSRKLDREEVEKIAPSISAVFATRILKLIRGKLSFEGIDGIQKDSCSNIFLFTHKSFLDFVVAPLLPLAMAARNNSERKLPLFLMAEDHFKRNPLFYSIFGIGMAAEALGMIFVKRGKKGGREEAVAISKIASERIIRDGSDLAIFPQGSRALPYASTQMIQLDAGYYTVGSKTRMKKYGAHLKKGTAFITVEVLLEAAKSEKSFHVRLIPIAISGTALACPKGRSAIKPNVSIKLSAGTPIVRTTASVDDMKGLSGKELQSKKEHCAAIIMEMIDSELKGASKVHAELERRFTRDISEMLDSLGFDEIALAMKSWRGEDYLVHSILDCIYTCKHKLWRQLTGELVHHIQNFSERDELQKFKEKVVDLIKT